MKETNGMVLAKIRMLMVVHLRGKKNLLHLLKGSSKLCPIGYTPGDSTPLIVRSIMESGSSTGVATCQTPQGQMEPCSSMKETCAFAMLMLLEPQFLTSFENIRSRRNVCIRSSVTTNTNSI